MVDYVYNCLSGDYYSNRVLLKSLKFKQIVLESFSLCAPPVSHIFGNIRQVKSLKNIYLNPFTTEITSNVDMSSV